MQKTLYTLLTLFTLHLTAYTQTPPAIQWQKNLGGSSTDIARDIKQTRDGGYIVAGFTASNDSDVTGNHGLSDCWIVKFDSASNIQWKKTYGGSYGDFANSILPLKDGGYIIAAETNSPDGDVVGGVHGSTNDEDYWVFKIDSAGNLLWQKVYGGSRNDIAKMIVATIDNGFAIVGYTESDDGDVVGNHSAGANVTFDIWVVKIDSLGNKQWSKCYGGTNNEEPYSIAATNTGSFYVAGGTISNDGDVSGNHGKADCWVIKIGSSGNLIWQKSLGGTQEEVANTVEVTTDGGCIISGPTWSNNGDVSGNHGNADAWIVKLDSTSTIEWQKCFGGSSGESFYSVKKTIGGGYVFAGSTASNDGDINGVTGTGLLWVMQTDSLGNIIWQKRYGGTGFEEAYSIIETRDKGFAFAGVSNSNNGDLTANYGTSDYWVVKLKADSLLPLDFIDYQIVLKSNNNNRFFVENNWLTGNEMNVSHFNVQADSSFYCTFWKLKIRLFFIVQCLPFYPLSPSL